MYNTRKPNPSDLPSTAKLLQSTALAGAVAGVLLVTIVLPAEYGIDPTRVGGVFGLTEMGRIKRSLAADEAAEAAADAAGGIAAAPAVVAQVASAAVQGGARQDTTLITLAPDQGAEIKLVMERGAVATFHWSSSGGKVNFDTHGDAPGIKYHAYGKGSEKEAAGDLTAAFKGSHGWFWRNRTGEPVTITLRTEGAYAEVKRVV